MKEFYPLIFTIINLLLHIIIQLAIKPHVSYSPLPIYTSSPVPSLILHQSPNKRNRRTGKYFCLYLSNFFFTINHHKNRITVLRQFHQLGMLKD